MFSITSKSKQGFELIELKDHSGKTYAAIIPACGGILHSFNVWHKDGFVNVIDSYDSREDFEKNVTAKGFKSCKLSPFSCRIKNAAYTFEGTPYITEKFLLNGNALHGLLYDAVFTVAEQSADENAATLVLQHQYRGTDKGYPFHYDCIITYSLTQHNQLTLSTKLINRDNSNIPVQDGWHPYFTLGKKIDELQLKMQTKDHVVFDEKLIPTGELKPYEVFNDGKKIGAATFDDCFSVILNPGQPVCIIKDEENNLQVEVWPDNTYPYLQIYTPPHRNSIAIENLSAPPDTFNNGISAMVLQSGEHAVFTTMYKVTAL